MERNARTKLSIIIIKPRWWGSPWKNRGRNDQRGRGKPVEWGVTEARGRGHFKKQKCLECQKLQGTPGVRKSLRFGNK